MGELIGDLGEDAGEWYAALDAVLALHTPPDERAIGDVTLCGACSGVYPCRTVQVIAEAIPGFDPEE